MSFRGVFVPDSRLTFVSSRAKSCGWPQGEERERPRAIRAERHAEEKDSDNLIPETTRRDPANWQVASGERQLQTELRKREDGPLIIR